MRTGPAVVQAGQRQRPAVPRGGNALAAWAKRRREPVVLDGEIVALDEQGAPAGFQRLRGALL
ncbi:MAG: hypothetical protein QM736_19585 [Vicinamibacterales bacterium]